VWGTCAQNMSKDVNETSRDPEPPSGGGVERWAPSDQTWSLSNLCGLRGLNPPLTPTLRASPSLRLLPPSRLQGLPLGDPCHEPHLGEAFPNLPLPSPSPTTFPTVICQKIPIAHSLPLGSQIITNVSHEQEGSMSILVMSEGVAFWVTPSNQCSRTGNLVHRKCGTPRPPTLRESCTTELSPALELCSSISRCCSR
jgi:hypothetical protein